MGLFDVDTPVQVRNFNIKTAPFEMDIVSLGASVENNLEFNVTAKITNISEEVLDAYSVGFEMITVFDEYIQHQSGFGLGDISPGKSKQVKWSLYVHEPHIVGTLVAYQFKSRLKSGKVWICDTKMIEKQILDLYNEEVDIIKSEKVKRKK